MLVYPIKSIVWGHLYYHKIVYTNKHAKSARLLQLLNNLYLDNKYYFT